MGGRKKEEEIRRLAMLTSFDMERENNIATNQELLASLNLTGTTADQSEECRSDQNQESHWRLPLQRTATSASALLPGTHNAPSSSSNAEDHPLTRNALSVSVQSRSASSARVLGDYHETLHSSSLSSPEWPINLPDWLQAHLDRLLKAECSTEHQPSWKQLLKDWASLEAAFGFKCPRRGITANRRPPAISLWIQNARETELEIKDLNSYEEQWNRWWGNINPPWRTKVDGRFVIGGCGDWSNLFCPGKNGFLSVIQGLLGLRSVATASNWEAALQDVGWVVQQVLAAKRSAR